MNEALHVFCKDNVTARLQAAIKAAPLLLAGALLLAAGNAAANDDTSDHFKLQDFLPRSFQKNPCINLTVITEVTAEGGKISPAAPGKPVYYIGGDGGLTEAGDAIGNEQPPPVPVLRAAMIKALAANGYLPADAAHPPSLFIFYRWGSFNHVNGFVPGGMNEFQRRNLLERAALVGGSKFGLDVGRAMNAGMLDQFRHKDPKTNQLLDQAFENLYFVIVSAYDINAAQNGQQKLLWRTKMSTPSHGITMEETLPLLVISAAPYFGREMTEAKPLQMQLLEGKVQLSERR